jgi:hypothetical protein
MKTSLFIFALSSMIVCAETRSLDPLTDKRALAGVWEAVPGGDAVGMASAVYRMEIVNDAESYLVAIVGPAPYCQFLCHLVDISLVDGKVTLRFRSAPGAKPTHIYGDREYVIEGTASGDTDGSGAIHGKFISRKTDDYPESVNEIFFMRRPWTRDLQQLSKDAERAIEEHRRKPKP